MRKLLLLFCLYTLLAVALAGCGGNKDIQKAPYEDIPLKDIEGNDLTGASAEQLYQAGHELLYAGSPREALRVYLQIQTDYPFSAYATQAALETATAHYMLDDFARTVSATDRFIKQHPSSPNTEYAFYLRGLANYRINDPGLLGGDADQRDLSYLRQAFSDFKLLIRNYPNSVYAKDAQMHMIDIRNRLANFELGVAEYYLKRRAYVGAARRASYILEHYQRSTAAPRALEIMQESYTQLGLSGPAGDARAILQASYPDYILHRDDIYRERLQEKREGGTLGWFWAWRDKERDEEHEPNEYTERWLSGTAARAITQPGPAAQQEQADQQAAEPAPADAPRGESEWLSGTATKTIGQPSRSAADRAEEQDQTEQAVPEDADSQERHRPRRIKKRSSGSSKWLEGGASKQM